MIMKVPSNDWSDQFEYVIEQEDDSLSDVEDEQDFSDYMWMENEEEFDKNELQRLEEEDLMNECIEAMLEDELEAEIAQWKEVKAEEINAALSSMEVSGCNVEHSSLNPLADEFIPQSHFIDLGTS